MKRHSAALYLWLGIVACEGRGEATWHEADGYRWRDLAVARRGRAGFDALSGSATGLTHRNDVDDERAMANRSLLIGAGVALGDIDGDNRLDVFLASVEAPARLYRNLGNSRFADVTAQSGVDARGLATISAVFADVDGDSDLDLLVGTLGGPLKLWIGDGAGRFRDATSGSGLVGGYAAAALTLADVEGDGDLDLYVGTYKTRNALDVYPPGARTFDQVIKKVEGKYVVEGRWASEYRVEDRPDLGGVIRSQRAEPDLFFLNDGRGRFTRTPISGARFADENGQALAAEPDYFTLAARFYDVNDDGAPDLYVCNDFEDPDQFWLNDGAGNFRLAPRLALRETSNTCMSVDFADVNRDGYVDLFTADMMSPTLAARQRQIPTHTPMPKPVGLSDERQQWMRNTLHVARGDGTWAQVADYAGVAATDWTWGSGFVDVDLDGYEDLLALNGHRWDIRDADTFERIRNSFPRVAWNREQGEFPRLTARSVALRNNGDLTFRDVSRAWRFGSEEAISHGLALGDLDGDGDLDAVATRLNAPPMVYRNTSAAPRVAVQLAAKTPNHRGVGARVTVRATTLPTQTREVTAGGYYLSGSDAVLSFATGHDTTVAIEVRWRSGRVSRIPDARPNRMYEIAEKGALPVPATSAPGHALFEDATPLLGRHTHVDSVFDDFRRQPLLPNRFSQLGPGLSWIDIDGNGREDLVIGTGRGGRTTVLRNTDRGFLPLESGDVSRWDVTTIVPVPSASGGVALLTGQSNYEARTAAQALAVPSVVGLAMRRGVLFETEPALAPDTASVGPLALADVNGDGRLDLFVGARVIPGAWPLPAPSRLFLRMRDGSWAPDTLNAPVLKSLGLVSAALFTNIDGDGDADLVTLSEWGPIRILQNEGGRLRDATREWGLSGQSSRWNGVTSGDFDGDGRLDLIATSWGRNTPWRASKDRPHVLIAGNFGGAGLGLVFARRDSATGREMPLEPFSRLSLAVPSVRERVATFADFSRATVDDLLGPHAGSAVRVGATTFDHVVLLNRGNRFELQPLPPAAQLAPAFGAVVGDFDGDAREDLFLAQNFSATEIETPRFDAGVGIVLLGDGRGGFRALGVREAGIRVFGDQRGAAAADYDADGRLDLAVSQNGALTTLWRNRGGTPGLRVRLRGGADNPWGIGARLRVVTGDRAGPTREVHAGSGYWSMDGATTVLALPLGARAVEVRWPGGAAQTVPLTPGQRELIVAQP